MSDNVTSFTLVDLFIGQLDPRSNTTRLFFLWRQMRQLVYSTPVRHSEMDLIGIIAEAAVRIQEDIHIFERVRRSSVENRRMYSRVQG
jgi:hypothetical protein